VYLPTLDVSKRPAAASALAESVPEKLPAGADAGSRLAWLGLVGLVLVAALVRLPYLWDIPLLSDETLDSMVSWRFYSGQKFPLHNQAQYVGAFYNYLEATAFLIWPSIYTPRLLIWLLGALAVAATYFLARELLQTRAAWLAAGLLATNGVHVGGNSHVAWSQCTTPLFLSLALLFLHRAVRLQSGRGLLAVGFLSGITLQTHPTAIAFLLGMAIYLLWKGRAFLTTRWPYLAGCLFLVAYGNLVVYNLRTDFESLRSAQKRDAAYGEYEERDTDTYLTSQRAIMLTLTRFPAGAIDARSEAADYLTDPAVVVYAGLALGGFVLLARAGNPLPALVLLTGLLVMPVFGARHDLLPRQGRYLAPLLPLIFTALAAAVWQLRAPLGRVLRRRGLAPALRQRIGLAAVVLLVLLPLIPLQRYYSQNAAAGLTNDRFFSLLSEIEASRPHGEFVLLDFQLAQDSLGGGGTALRTMDFFLTVRGIPHEERDIEPDRVLRRYANTPTIVVLREKTFDRVSAELPLTTPNGQRPVPRPNPYGVYRLAPST
jgi:4-amino-4-deoxy-L-arabinose transferase-like glycosyltransferase